MDFWDSLPPKVQQGILEAKTQVEEGNYKVHEEVVYRNR
jgi:TRAP-type C4-dicarboxylate transport system substrate-binding protein